MEERNLRKVMIGTVVSDKMDKTVVVAVETSVRHKVYKKTVKYLLKNELVSFIASDCHDIVKRTCDFSIAKSFIKKKYKKQYDKLFNTVPEFVY